jgi:NAD(P)-dependent dehydrogenase (short-subunit alcohol dehydrogenase family)
MTGRLSGEVAIVTGGGRGFGRAMAQRLAREGAAVTVIARTRSELDETVRLIAGEGGRAFAATADVTDREATERAVAEAEAKFGPATILVNSTGRAHPYGPIGEFDPDEWWETQAVHVKAPLMAMSAVLPGMRARRKGHIVNIASRGGREVTAYLSAYCCGKAAEIRLTEHVAVENKDMGVFAFSIEPGTTWTAMAEETTTNPQVKKWLPWAIDFLNEIKRNDNPERVFGRCGDMIVALCSGKYDALTGRYLDPADDFDALLREQNGR